MGYRSNLYIKCKKEKAPLVYSELKKYNMVNYCNFSEDSTYFYAEMSGLKWYDSYEGIPEINDFMSNTPDVAMIRIGEEYEDVEYYGNACDLDMWIYVEVDGGSGTTPGLDSLKTSHPELFI